MSDDSDALRKDSRVFNNNWIYVVDLCVIAVVEVGVDDHLQSRHKCNINCGFCDDLFRKRLVNLYASMDCTSILVRANQIMFGYSLKNIHCAFSIIKYAKRRRSKSLGFGIALE